MKEINPEYVEAVKEQMANFKPDDSTPYKTFDTARVYTINSPISESAQGAIHKVSLQLEKEFPEHFYYPPERYHVTIQAVPYSINPDEFIPICDEIIKGSSFEVQMLGAAVNPYGGSAVAYPLTPILPLRHKLRQAFGKAVDYSVHRPVWEELLWTTFMRFRTKATPAFLEAVRELQDRQFGGTFTITTFELWEVSTKVLEPGKSRLLHTFKA